MNFHVYIQLVDFIRIIEYLLVLLSFSFIVFVLERFHKNGQKNKKSEIIALFTYAYFLVLQRLIREAPYVFSHHRVYLIIFRCLPLPFPSVSF